MSLLRLRARRSGVVVVAFMVCAALNTYAQSGWTTAFEDDFESGETLKWILEEGWDLGQDSSSVLKGEGSANAAVPLADMWRNYAVSFKFKLIQGQFDFIFRNREFPPLATYDKYMLLVGGEGIRLRKHKGHLETDDIPLTTMSYGFEIGQWYELGVICKDAYIDVYVDGQPILSFRDSDNPLFVGQFAFFLVEDTIVHLDDVEVRSE